MKVYSDFAIPTFGHHATIYYRTLHNEVQRTIMERPQFTDLDSRRRIKPGTSHLIKAKVARPVKVCMLPPPSPEVGMFAI
jgi:hypothetical protein